VVFNELRDETSNIVIKININPQACPDFPTCRGQFRFMAHFRRFQNSHNKPIYFTDVRVTSDVEGVLVIILRLFSSLTVSINNRRFTEFLLNWDMQWSLQNRATLEYE